MNTPLKHTIIAMATAALGFAAVGCSSEEAPEAAESSTGGESSYEAGADPTADPASAGTPSDAEASCAEGSCAEGSCA